MNHLYQLHLSGSELAEIVGVLLAVVIVIFVGGVFAGLVIEWARHIIFGDSDAPRLTPEEHSKGCDDGSIPY